MISVRGVARAAVVAAVVMLAVGGTAFGQTHAPWPTNWNNWNDPALWVTVGNPGNVADTRYASPGYCGAVSYAYNIGKYEVTAGQYTAFLNKVAATDTYGLYNTGMWSDTYGCKIQRSGSSGSYTYSVASDWANRPVNYVSFWDSCRFANWLTNGQPTGAQGAGTTERGAYTLDGYNGDDGRTIQRNANAKYVIPTEDEWYKAAYYKGGSTNAGYWDYPTSSDTAPGQDMADASGNNANYPTAPNAYPIDSGKYTTVAGEFQNSDSPYGTFDQGGNVWEWNEAIPYQDATYAYRGLRGGSFHGTGGCGGDDQALHAAGFGGAPPTYGYNDIGGFRVSAVLGIYSRQDITIFGANHYSTGDFGTSSASMDPLFQIDSPLAGLFRTGGSETFGNNVETQNGWESTQTWGPYQLPGDTTWRAGKGFDAGMILKGQYSRVGTKPGNFALFGVGFVNDAEWRTRGLETYSSGSVSFQDLGTAPTQVKVGLDYDARINGSALEKSAAVAINLIPMVVGAVAKKPPELAAALLNSLIESQAKKWVGIQQQLVTEKSDFSGSAEMQLQLTQDGQVVGTLDVSSPEFAPGSVEARYGGYVMKTTRRINGQTTVSVDPTKPLDYRLDITTHAGALGTGQSYMGVPYYKLEFSTPGVASVPLVIERRDPAGDPGNPKALLYGTVGTPELIEGNVQLVESIGPYSAQTEEKLVTFSNAATSGFTMPVSLVDGDDSLQVKIASLVSGQTNLDKVGVQIGYTTGDEFYSLFDDTLANLFTYEANSGLTNMPYASQFADLNLDITSLPRGDLMLLFAFGDLDASGLESTLVMDSFTVAPEPATLALVALGGLALLRRRCR